MPRLSPDDEEYGNYRDGDLYSQSKEFLGPYPGFQRIISTTEGGLSIKPFHCTSECYTQVQNPDFDILEARNGSVP